MPTSNPPPTQSRPRWKRATMGTVLLLAVLLAWGWTPLTRQAEAGTAFGARVACSCKYVGGRDLASCEGDFLDGMALVSLSEDASAKTVTASVPLIASTTATYRKGWGCMLEPYEG